MTEATPPVTVHHLLEHREWVRALTRRLVFDENQAADLEQQTWLRVMRSPPKSGHAPKAWLGTVVRNLARDAARRRERRGRREVAAARPEALSATVDLVGQAEALGRVVQAVVALDEPYRTTVLLRFFEGLPPRDVAARMDAPVETVRTRLRRALEKLRESLDPERTDDPDGARAALLALAGVGTGTAVAGVGTGRLVKGAVAAAVIVGIGLWWMPGEDELPRAVLVPPPSVDHDVASAETDPWDEPRAAVVEVPTDEPDSADGLAETASSGRPERTTPVRVEPRPEDEKPPEVVKPVPPPPPPRNVVDAPEDGGGDVRSAADRPPPPEPLYQDDATRAWDEKYASKERAAARTFERLADWCLDNDLQWTSLRVRRRVLHYLPDDPEVRELLGYLRQGEAWVRDPVVLDHLQTNFVDDGNPTGATYGKHYAQAEQRVSNAFRLLARQADRAARDARKDDLQAAAKAWDAAAARAWARVLELDPGVEKHCAEAHVALDHPKFDGAFVTPHQLRYMQRRAERLRDGRKHAAAEVQAEPTPATGPVAKAGLAKGSARSKHVEVHTSHDEEVALRAARAAERAIADALATYGWPAEILERMGTLTLHVVKRTEKGNEELIAVLRAAGVPEARLEKLQKLGFGGDALSLTERVVTTSSGADLEDQVMNTAHNVLTHFAGAWSASRNGARLRAPEDWLWQSMGYDGTQRLNGTTLTVWGAFGDYGRKAAPRPGQNVWIQLARQQVELDEDVPLIRLVNLTLPKQQFKGHEIVKGYAFLQFLLEDDADRAKRFVELALAQGSAVAAMEVFGENVLGDEVVREHSAELPGPGDSGPFPEPYRRVLGELDTRYRVWIEKAW